MTKKSSGLKLLPAHTARAAFLAERRENAAAESALTARAAEAFIKQLGGRTYCGELLAVAAESTEGRDAGPLETLSMLLLDPGYDRMSLADLCEQAGLTLRDLFRAHRGATLVRAQIISTEKIAAKLPEVVEDVMRRAAPHTKACEKCKGTGSISPEGPDAAPAPCPACGASGTVAVDPELDRQKLALELGDLLKKGGGISLTQQNLNVNAGGANGGGAGSYERYQQALMHVLSAPLPAAPPPASDPIDVTPEPDRGGEA